MKDERRAILTYLRHVPAADVHMILEDFTAMGSRHADRATLQAALHQMDDAGDVLMRNGIYRISERARAET